MASNRRRANSADILRISSLARGGGIQDIYTDRTRGGRVANITQGSNGLTAFCLYPQGSDPQIWTIGGENGFPTELGQGVNPAISPDGSRIAFVRDGDIYVMNSDGTGATQLTFDAGQILRRTDEFLTANGDVVERTLWSAQRKYFQANSSPSWSPDGNAIAFTSSRSVDADGRPNEDIYIVQLAGGEPRQLTTNRSTDRTPVFSPDGQSLYFVSNRGGNWAIWRTPVADR
jgi:dipeptidyl aminopeptidase/acylaminoacyl peptidase